MTFEGGPATGRTLNLRRLPDWLRVVTSERHGTVDALDQLEDAPDADEVVHVYRRTFHAFACRGGGPGEVATYQHVPGLDAEAGQLREREAWRARVAELCGEELNADGSPKR